MYVPVANSKLNQKTYFTIVNFSLIIQKLSSSDMTGGGGVVITEILINFLWILRKQVTCLCVTMDGCQLVSGSHDHKVKIWDIFSGQCLRTIEHKGSSMHIQVDYRIMI